MKGVKYGYRAHTCYPGQLWFTFYEATHAQRRVYFTKGSDKKFVRRSRLSADRIMFNHMVKSIWLNQVFHTQTGILLIMMDFLMPYMMDLVIPW